MDGGAPPPLPPGLPPPRPGGPPQRAGPTPPTTPPPTTPPPTTPPPLPPSQSQSQLPSHPPLHPPSHPPSQSADEAASGEEQAPAEEKQQVLFVEAQGLTQGEVHNFYHGFGEYEVKLVNETADGLVQYEVKFDDLDNLLQASDLQHPKMTKCTMAEEGANAVQELASAAPLNLPVSVAAVMQVPLVCDNLAYWTTEDDIRRLFSEYGEVQDVAFAVNDLNGVHHGCCQVKMALQSAAQAAEAALDGKKVNGQIMVVGVRSSCGYYLTNIKGTGPPQSVGMEFRSATRLNFGPQGP